MLNPVEHPFNTLIGQELSSVEFVRDYVQLRFDGPCLTILSKLQVKVSENFYLQGHPGFCDALCDQIGLQVTEIDFSPQNHLKIEVGGKVWFYISLKSQDFHGPEALLFATKTDELWVW